MDGEQMPNTPASAHSLERWPRIGAIIVIAAVVLLAAAYAYGPTRTKLRAWYRAAMIQASGVAVPEGNLYLTLQEGSQISARLLDLQTGDLLYRALDDGRALQAMAVSPTGDRRAYFIAAQGDKPAEIRIYTPATNERMTVLSPAPATARHIRWSPDGTTLVFTAREQAATGENDVAASDWAVYTVPAAGGEKRRVATGVSPFFSPDGGMVFTLQDDGLYVTSLTDGTKKIVRGMQNGEAHRFMDVDLSPDGSKLLWTNPLSANRVGKLLVFDVLSWTPVRISQTAHVIEMPALHAVFSPDSKFIAYLTNPDAKSGVNPGIYTLDLKTFVPKLVLDLAGFNLQSTALTDWR